jgi:hypothetical protein
VPHEHVSKNILAFPATWAAIESVVNFHYPEVASEIIRHLPLFKKGKILNSSDFEYLRPQLGVSADKYEELIGKKISKNINIGDFVR